jgi:Zn-dependent protease
MDPNDLLLRAVYIIPTLLSLTVHEWAHAWSANKLGDDTAEREGRLTLNPIAHIDPLGTILLPLIGVPFGWAKPVPVNPARFRRDVHMGTGMAITAAAGPLSNLVLAVLCAVATGLYLRFNPGVHLQQSGAAMLLIYGVQLNVGLALFNMLPLPPLDGSRILERFIPFKQQAAWDSFKRFGPLLLLAVFASGGVLLGRPIRAVSEAMFDLMWRLAA